MKAAEYLKIRIRMLERGVTQSQLAYVLGTSRVTVNRKMSGAFPWTLDEVYTICTLLDIPVTDFPIYFPNRVKNPLEVKLK